MVTTHVFVLLSRMQFRGTGTHAMGPLCCHIRHLLSMNLLSKWTNHSQCITLRHNFADLAIWNAKNRQQIKEVGPRNFYSHNRSTCYEFQVSRPRFSLINMLIQSDSRLVGLGSPWETLPEVQLGFDINVSEILTMRAWWVAVAVVVIYMQSLSALLQTIYSKSNGIKLWKIVKNIEHHSLSVAY